MINFGFFLDFPLILPWMVLLTRSDLLSACRVHCCAVILHLNLGSTCTTIYISFNANKRLSDERQLNMKINNGNNSNRDNLFIFIYIIYITSPYTYLIFRAEIKLDFGVADKCEVMLRSWHKKFDEFLL